MPSPQPRADMRRRELLGVIGGAAAWPLAARAQQSAKLPTIGYLGPSTPSAQRPWTAAFVQGLREFGWIEGRTIAIEYRWAEGRNERFVEIAAEFVQLNVDIIVTYSAAPVLAARRATSIIPIVFPAAPDPLGSGLVASLARPGGNVTGFSTQSTDLPGKRLEFLREVVPGLRRLGIMANLGNPGAVQSCARFRLRPEGSASRSQISKFSAPRISRPPLRLSRVPGRHFMSVPSRS